MPSPLLVGLEQHLGDLQGYFIMQRDDYSLYTAEDHAKALAYRLLASAALENFVEARCLEIARTGVDRLGKSQPSATGRALMIWSASQASRWDSAGPIYIHESDPLTNAHLANAAFEKYSKTVKKSHGIGGDDLRSLVFPLGLRESQVPEVLTVSLDDLAAKRNPASHTYVNHAKSLTEPSAEVAMISQILKPLRGVDDDLRIVSETWPISHL